MIVDAHFSNGILISHLSNKKNERSCQESLRFGLNALVTHFYRSFPKVDTLDLWFRTTPCRRNLHYPPRINPITPFLSMFLRTAEFTGPVLSTLAEHSMFTVGLICLYHSIRITKVVRGNNKYPDNPEYMDI